MKNLSSKLKSSISILGAIVFVINAHALTITEVGGSGNASDLLRQRTREFVRLLTAGTTSEGIFSFDFPLDGAFFLCFCVPGADMTGRLPFVTATTIYNFPKSDGSFLLLWLDDRGAIRDYVMFAEPDLHIGHNGFLAGGIENAVIKLDNNNGILSEPPPRGTVELVLYWAVRHLFSPLPPHSARALDYEQKTGFFFRTIESQLREMNVGESRTFEFDFADASTLIFFTPHDNFAALKLSPDATFGLKQITQDDYSNGLAWIDGRGELVDYYVRVPYERYSLTSGIIRNHYYDPESSLIIPSTPFTWNRGDKIRIRKKGKNRFEFYHNTIEATNT